MGEEFKVVAVVKFNDGEALVLNRPIAFIYSEDGNSLIGADGPFRDFLGYSSETGAFAGSEFKVTMADGSVRKIKDHWWSTYKEPYNSIAAKDIEGLKKCYVFSSAHITPEDYAALRGAYTGTVFDYWDYEKILMHEYWVDLYLKESQKVRELKDKERKRIKRYDLIRDLLVGRSALLHAAEHLKDFRRQLVKDSNGELVVLKCTLEDDEHYLPNNLDHIGKYKKAGKEHGWDSVEDELFEINECPLCSAMWAAYKARRIMKAKAGLINGILTRMGNHLREKE